MSLLKTLLIAFIFGIAWSSQARALDDIRIGFADIPGVETHPHEILIINLLEALAEQDFIGDVEVVRVPFARSIVELTRGHLDAHLPIKYDPADLSGAENYMLQFGTPLNKVQYNSENLFKVKFVIVTREEERMTPQQALKSKVLTDISHVAFFKEKFGPSHCMKCSLSDVKNGLLEGYLFEEQKVKHAIQTMDFVDYRLNTYGLYDVRFLTQNTKHGTHIRNLLDRALANLKATGEFDKIMGPLIANYGY